MKNNPIEKQRTPGTMWKQLNSGSSLQLKTCKTKYETENNIAQIFFEKTLPILKIQEVNDNNCRKNFNYSIKFLEYCTQILFEQELILHQPLNNSIEIHS